MDFDAPEKKCELRLVKGQKSLRSYGKIFWDKVVRDSRAQILSYVQNADCDAYLLSESSLFVYDDKCLMITCGQTDLAKAISELLSVLGQEAIQLFIYERKIGHFPDQHPFQIEDDYKLLSNQFDLQRHIFNGHDDSPIHIFFYQKAFFDVEEDGTIEILMHDLSPNIFEQFSLAKKDGFHASLIYQKLCALLEGFKCDEYFFDPCGYSLNAIRGHEYATIHVTPQKEGSYVSFETNLLHRDNELNQIILDCVNIFQSNTFDVVVFDTKKINWNETLSPSMTLINKQEQSIHSLYQLECRRYQRTIKTE